MIKKIPVKQKIELWLGDNPSHTFRFPGTEITVHAGPAPDSSPGDTHCTVHSVEKEPKSSGNTNESKPEFVVKASTVDAPLYLRQMRDPANVRLKESTEENLE